MSGSIGRGVHSEINVTPLVDIVLVLLIIFMVLTPVLQMGLDVEVPPKVEVSTPPPDSEATQLVVAVRDDGIYLNKEKIGSPDELRKRLAAVLPARKEDDRVVFLTADDDVGFDRTVKAMDAARGAGALRVGFLTDPLK
ncbi:MAG: biopolymer transporter ExbD [Thermoanaerobaculia bacterium]